MHRYAWCLTCFVAYCISQGGSLEVAHPLPKTSIVGFSDPLVIDKNLTVSDNAISLNISIKGLLKNFSKYNFSKASVDPQLNADLDIHIPNLSFDGKYKMEGIVYHIVPLDGEGPLSFDMNDFSLATSVSMSGKYGQLFIKNFKLSYSVTNLKLGVSGLLKDEGLSEISKEVIHDLVPGLVIKLRSRFEKDLESYINDKLSISLRHMNLKQIVEKVKAVANTL